MTLGVDGGPGVVVQGWITNGTDFLATLTTLGKFDDYRLYPTKLSSPGEDGLTYYVYHLNYQPNGGKPDASDPWSEFNDYWYQIDSLIWGNLATDALIIGFDKDGIVQNVQDEALRETLYRE
jgi:hypothetical protein